ncbi:MAG: hypothetical protein AAGI24_09175 [Pseudomonadota bacterium]
MASCASMVVVIAAMLSGAISPFLSAFALLLMALICAAAPQLGGYPRFEDLAEILLAKQTETPGAHGDAEP